MKTRKAEGDCGTRAGILIYCDEKKREKPKSLHCLKKNDCYPTLISETLILKAVANDMKLSNTLLTKKKQKYSTNRGLTF